MSWGKRSPRSQSPIVVGDTPAALASARSEGSSDSGPALNARSAFARTKNSPAPAARFAHDRPPRVHPVQPCAGQPTA